jgi:hypothetical protein
MQLEDVTAKVGGPKPALFTLAQISEAVQTERTTFGPIPTRSNRSGITTYAVFVLALIWAMEPPAKYASEL